MTCGQRTAAAVWIPQVQLSQDHVMHLGEKSTAVSTSLPQQGTPISPSKSSGVHIFHSTYDDDELI